MSSLSPYQPPLPAPATGVTSAFALTAPLTPGGLLARTLPCQTGLRAVDPSLAVATKTVLGFAAPVETSRRAPNGTQPEPPGAHACQDHVWPLRFACELTTIVPLPSRLRT